MFTLIVVGSHLLNQTKAVCVNMEAILNALIDFTQDFGESKRKVQLVSDLRRWSRLFSGAS